MSAAEKLERLNVELLEDSRTFCNVLPEVIAVVKAVEAVAGPTAYRDGLTGRAAQVRDALSALDEKLENVT